MDECGLVIIRAGRIGGERMFLISNDVVVNDTLFVKILFKRRQNQYISLCKQYTLNMYCRILYLTYMFFLIFPNLSDNRSISLYNKFWRNPNMTSENRIEINEKSYNIKTTIYHTSV